MSELLLQEFCFQSELKAWFVEEREREIVSLCFAQRWRGLEMMFTWLLNSSGLWFHLEEKREFFFWNFFVCLFSFCVRVCVCVWLSKFDYVNDEIKLLNHSSCVNFCTFFRAVVWIWLVYACFYFVHRLVFK